MDGQNTEETQDGKFDFKPGLRIVPLGAVTREVIEALILSAEREGLAISRLPVV